MAGILLDTNVISEVVAPRPSDAVLEWLARQDPPSLFLSVITIGELLEGVFKRAPGRRTRELQRWVEHDLMRQFEGRVLVLDERSARCWGHLLGEARRRGRPLPVIDAQITAMALVHGLAVATRDAAGFSGTGVEIVDPWQG
jgi:predicted nucleic acid-binding protein